MKIEVEYRQGVTRGYITFKDIDGATACVSVEKLADKPARVNWPIPGNNTLPNARIYADAIETAVGAAEVIESGKRLEVEWGSEAEVVVLFDYDLLNK